MLIEETLQAQLAKSDLLEIYIPNYIPHMISLPYEGANLKGLKAACIRPGLEQMATPLADPAYSFHIASLS
ncbi:MAG: hypothetical protein KC643_26455 [Nitrospira sp.]|nr:hypothetical protein [Nitrospira sp.]